MFLISNCIPSTLNALPKCVSVCSFLHFISHPSSIDTFFLFSVLSRIYLHHPLSCLSLPRLLSCRILCCGHNSNPDAPLHASLSKAYRTDELSEEMAHLEGLMKDLNAITTAWPCQPPSTETGLKFGEKTRGFQRKQPFIILRARDARGRASAVWLWVLFCSSRRSERSQRKALRQDISLIKSKVFWENWIFLKLSFFATSSKYFCVCFYVYVHGMYIWFWSLTFHS